MAHPEDELERLTKKMLFDMDNPPSEEYFGKEEAHLAHMLLATARTVYSQPTAVNYYLMMVSFNFIW